LSYVAWSALQHFSIMSYKWTDLLQKKSLNIQCVVIFSTNFETLLILIRNERDMMISENWPSCKVLDILVRFPLNLNFLDMFSKNNQIPKFHENMSVRAELLHANRRTNGQT